MSGEPRPDSEPSSTGIGSPFEVGSVIAGKYRVDRILGAGGMGVIFAGHHTALDQRVAIKVLKPSAIDNAELVARFGREARAAARLRSEHVARVLDVGETDKGIPFMVMEYLSGKDLSRIVKEQGPLSVEDACEYVLQACEGLAEAHAAGIVHRDLKPANLFLTRGTDGTALVKVLDFGISKILSSPGDDAPSEGLTQTQAMIGSPHYMSPEQLKSAKDVDSRTDIWSLGGVLFKLLTNEPAFEGQSTPELCVSILVGPLRSMREIRSDIPEDLEAIVAKCLSKDANDRFGTVSDLARALSRFAPLHTRSSVERIARVGTNPRLRFGGGSDPPPRPQSSPSFSSGKTPVAAQVSAEAGTVDVKLEMTTLTSSASSVPNDTSPSRSRSASLALPLESNKRPWMLAGVGAAVLAVVVGGVIVTMKSSVPGTRGGAAPPPDTASQAPPNAAGAPSATAIATAAMTAAPAESAPAASATPSATIAPTAKTPSRPGVPSKATPASPKTSPVKTAAAPPTTATTATPATTPATTSGMPDFGGRK